MGKSYFLLGKQINDNLMAPLARWLQHADMFQCEGSAGGPLQCSPQNKTKLDFCTLMLPALMSVCVCMQKVCDPLFPPQPGVLWLRARMRKHICAHIFTYYMQICICYECVCVCVLRYFRGRACSPMSWMRDGRARYRAVSHFHSHRHAFEARGGRWLEPNIVSKVKWWQTIWY